MKRFILLYEWIMVADTKIINYWELQFYINCYSILKHLFLKLS